MERLLITNCTLIGPSAAVEVAAVEVVHETITRIFPKGSAFDGGADCILDADGGYLSPGLIDVHTHGGFGFDFTTCSTEEYLQFFEKVTQFGTTHVMPTFITSPIEVLHAQTKLLAGFEREVGEEWHSVPRAKSLGLHWEGPFLSIAKKGAQPPEAIVKLDEAALRAVNDCAGEIQRLVLAPEEVELERLVFADPRLKLVIGHTNADYERALLATALGMDSFTHTFNGMSGFAHRAPGVVGAALSTDNTYCELICDGVHVLPPAGRVLFKARSHRWVMLITDGNAATGLPPGEYELAGIKMLVKEDACYLPDGTLAGSVITMDEAVRRAVRLLGATPFEAIQMATYTPARYLGEAGGRLPVRYGIRPGAPADLVVFDRNLQVLETLVDGAVAYSRNRRA